MSTQKTDTNAALPLANGIGYVVGLFSVAALILQQSLTILIPLLHYYTPTVCAIFCVLLYKTQTKFSPSVAPSDSPVRIDVI